MKNYSKHLLLLGLISYSYASDNYEGYECELISDTKPFMNFRELKYLSPDIIEHHQYEIKNECFLHRIPSLQETIYEPHEVFSLPFGREVFMGEMIIVPINSGQLYTQNLRECISFGIWNPFKQEAALYHAPISHFRKDLRNQDEKGYNEYLLDYLQENLQAYESLEIHIATTFWSQHLFNALKQLRNLGFMPKSLTVADAYFKYERLIIEKKINEFITTSNEYFITRIYMDQKDQTYNRLTHVQSKMMSLDTSNGKVNVAAKWY